MKYFMLMGPVAAGKTSLAQRLCGEEMRYAKTQSVELHGMAIDTPGEYIENRNLLRALTVTAADASCIVLLQDATAECSWYSPAQASMFNCAVLGAVTKTDLATPQRAAWAEDTLKSAGAQQVFRISNVTGEGIAELRECLEHLLER